jgi:hypothetical protein
MPISGASPCPHASSRATRTVGSWLRPPQTRIRPNQLRLLGSLGSRILFVHSLWLQPATPTLRIDVTAAPSRYSCHQFQRAKLSASHSLPKAVREALDHPTKSDFGSKYGSMPKAPFSRPRPDCLTSPNGAFGSLASVLTSTRPATICDATMRPCSVFDDRT